MLHRKRTHRITVVETAEDLAEKLTEHSYCGCQGFEHAGYLYLNDSTSGDGAQEYAIFRVDGRGGQIESITFGWCNRAKGLEYIRRITSGEFDRGELAESTYGRESGFRLDRAERHTCYLCA